MAETLIDQPDFLNYLLEIPNIHFHFKNELESIHLLGNVKWIEKYIFHCMPDMKEERIDLYFVKKNVVKLFIQNESFEIWIFNQEEMIEYMKNHFDEFFNLSHFTHSFVFSYFSDQTKSSITIPSIPFAKKLMETFSDDFDLHLMLKNAILDQDHFVRHVVELDGLNHYLESWFDENDYYDSENDLYIFQAKQV